MSAWMRKRAVYLQCLQECPTAGCLELCTDVNFSSKPLFSGSKKHSLLPTPAHTHPLGSRLKCTFLICF
ncbi:rCG35769 [Rattus norvegicus]|uniref:RCG35769 n=1 Tax=Rattus norvegicus TaxID=10116 RepID=A6IJP5_RAT|nr:rCG35769 [Rattus norvegicus]